MAWKLQYTTPQDLSGTAIGADIDSFAFNLKDQLIHIGYSKLETINSNLQTDIPHTLSGQEWTDFITSLNTKCPGASTALIQTCLEFLPDDGTLVNV